MPCLRAALANGERNFASNAKLRAIRAMVLATFCISNTSLSPCNFVSSLSKICKGTLSKTPSVANNITSPSSTRKFVVSADSGLQLHTQISNNQGYLRD